MDVDRLRLEGLVRRDQVVGVDSTMWHVSAKSVAKLSLQWSVLERITLRY
jgi:hypothetical protein